LQLEWNQELFLRQQPTMKIKKFSQGFTFIEMLVVVTIIGILSMIGVVNFKVANQKARDGRRQGDLQQIRAALELYRTDQNAYPTTAQFPAAGGSLIGGVIPGGIYDCVFIGQEIHCPSGGIIMCSIIGPINCPSYGGTTYMENIPGDPLSGYLYAYTSDGTTYTLCSALELGTGSVSCGTDCGTGTCRYKITQPL